MKLQRPNMSDLFRSFIGRGSDPSSPPEGSIEIDPAIAAVAEICRGLSRTPILAAANPLEESNGIEISTDVAPGASLVDSPVLTFAPGLWRLSLQLSAAVSGAAPVASNAVMLSVMRPGGPHAWGIHFRLPFLNALAFSQQNDLLLVTEPGWSVVLSVTDPVNALAVNRVAGAVYACRIL